nr:proliferating cell nuclear antigen [Andalucia godoyi]|eukprot:ANDGO_06909.mRNA.1 Proliferating cell nuclear antigen
MFEAKLPQASLLRKILDAIKDLVQDANFDCTSTGITLQAMDSSHVSLVYLQLRNDGFEQFRADRTLSLGMNLASLGKILKCASNDDSVTISTEDDGDSVSFKFESEDKDRVSMFTLKLIDIDSEHLGIPDQEYHATVKLPSSEFQRICRDLSTMGDTLSIAVTKEGVKFEVQGDENTGGSIMVRQSASVDKPDEAVSITLEHNVTLSFALRYLNSFAKATGLSPQVSLSLTKDVPLVVEYKIAEIGYLRFFLAPKIDEDAVEEENDA